ncbi:MAG TPA: hypothetical protein VE619_07590 [Nitrososphaeraceae archaeon]|nr:hypothetical protein [Nitrososphaeraceae archaeon]
MIYSDGKPIHGTKKTYPENKWGLHQDMQHNARKAMKFKESLGELHGNHDDTLVIYCNTLKTLDTIGYSSTGITIDENTSFHFSPPFDYGQQGDSIVVTHSAIGSMSDLHSLKYRHKSVHNVIHTALPNNDETIQEINEFLNPQ